MKLIRPPYEMNLKAIRRLYEGCDMNSAGAVDRELVDIHFLAYVLNALCAHGPQAPHILRRALGKLEKCNPPRPLAFFDIILRFGMLGKCNPP